MNTGGNFNWIAPVYDALAFVVFGHRLKKAQIVFLEAIPADASILIVGGGTGWLLEQILRLCRPNRVVYLEASSQMVALATKRVIQRGLIGSLEFRVGDELALKPDERFDVIMTPFVLDLFSEQTLQVNIIPKLQSVLKTDSLWLITDFVKPSIGWQKALLWTMIHFFRFTANIEVTHLADWQKQLGDAGLTREQQQKRVGGMVSSEVWNTK